MADDSRLRSYRSNDPYQRAAEPSEEANARDPLAELARLLGQSDPFAELGRTNQRPREARDAPATAPADWQAAAAPEPQFAAGGSTHGWASSNPDDARSPAPQNWRSDSGSYEETPVSAEQGAYDGDERTQGGQDDGYEPQYYDENVSLDPHEDAMYDDPPRARRRGGLATALALIGCAVFGTAGAYAFRTYYAGPSATQAPPIIAADASAPTKIVPAADSLSGRGPQDRLASADKEQVVSKQEEPVTLRDLANQAAQGGVLSAPGAPKQGASAAQPSAGTASGSNEPKKIRTVTIRPDGSDTSGRPVTSQVATAAAPVMTPAAPRQAAPVPSAPKPTPARNSGPISLDPQSEPSAAAPHTRTAAAPPAATPAAPDATENASDGYMVQLSSQKSEAEANSSFRSLQARFPNELNGLQPVVRRADLGSKGVFYRTMVGPFASAHEASQFCASYKAAGGQCVVPNN
jgi:hypothetical protein